MGCYCCYTVTSMMGAGAGAGAGVPSTMMSVEQKKKLLWGKKAEEAETAPVS